MCNITSFDTASDTLFQALKKKPVSFYFSQLPERLAHEIINEFNSERKNKVVLSLLNSYYQELICQLATYIRSVKMNNQLLLLDSPKKKLSRTDAILENLKSEYPNAFIRKYRKTKKGYGIKQVEINFPAIELPKLF